MIAIWLRSLVKNDIMYNLTTTFRLKENLKAILILFLILLNEKQMARNVCLCARVCHVTVVFSKI